MIRGWTLGVLACGLVLARCDFGIDTKGLVGDAQAEAESAPPMDAAEEPAAVDASTD